MEKSVAHASKGKQGWCYRLSQFLDGVREGLRWLVSHIVWVEDGLSSGDCKNGFELGSSISRKSSGSFPPCAQGLSVIAGCCDEISEQKQLKGAEVDLAHSSRSLQGRQGIRNTKQPTGHIIAAVRNRAGTECITVLSLPSLHSYTIQDPLPREWCQPWWLTGQPDLDSPSLRLLSRQL